MNRKHVQEGRGKTAAHSSCKYKLTLEYDGTGYSGWQVQKNARSIQGTLIDAARELFGTVVELHLGRNLDLMIRKSMLKKDS